MEVRKFGSHVDWSKSVGSSVKDEVVFRSRKKCSTAVEGREREGVNRVVETSHPGAGIEIYFGQ